MGDGNFNNLTVNGTSTLHGNVGIGATTTYSQLHIRKDSKAALGPSLTLMNGAGGAGAGSSLDFNGYDPGSANPPTARIQSLDDGHNSSHLAFLFKTPGAANNALVESLRVSSNGNVGVGTTTPDAKLTVVGGMRISDSDIWLRTTNDHYHGLGWYGNPKTFAGTNIDGPVLYGFSGGALATNNSNGQKLALCWNSSGNVGIGTNTPGAQLELNTSADQFPLRLTNGRTGGKAGLEISDTYFGSEFRVYISAGNLKITDNQNSDLLRVNNPNWRGPFGPVSKKIEIGTVFVNNLDANGDITLSGGDCAELFDTTGEAPPPGTVVTIDQNGALRESSRAYDNKVAGVISGAGDYRPGILLDRRESDEDRIPIALAGKVYCMVDADASPIEVGDLLTTSQTPGHAMKVSEPLKAFGAVLGKALAPLEQGRGLIPILVCLQ